MTNQNGWSYTDHTLDAVDGNQYRVRVGTNPDGEQFCSIGLLPLECLLFRACIDTMWMMKQLEDGDATHPLSNEVIDQIIATAVQHGFNWEPF